MAFAALAALTVAAGAADDTMELYKLPEGTVGGQCMDGSPAAYYYRQAQNASSTSWVIYLQGRSKSPPFASNNLLKNTDGVFRERGVG